MRTGRPAAERGQGACVSAIPVQDNVYTFTLPDHVDRAHVMLRDVCSAGDAECESHRTECGEP